MIWYFFHYFKTYYLVLLNKVLQLLFQWIIIHYEEKKYQIRDTWKKTIDISKRSLNSRSFQFGCFSFRVIKANIVKIRFQIKDYEKIILLFADSLSDTKHSFISLTTLYRTKDIDCIDVKFDIESVYDQYTIEVSTTRWNGLFFSQYV